MLPGLLRQQGLWKSLDISHVPPRVERVWAQVNDMRVNLHRAHPCDSPLFHGHPWPCAVRVVTGSYEVAVGHGPPGDPPPEAATFLLGPGSVYEMADMDSWHYVTPIGSPSLSLMVSGRPWGLRGVAPDEELRSLDSAAVSDILDLFRRLYPRV